MEHQDQSKLHFPISKTHSHGLRSILFGILGYTVYNDPFSGKALGTYNCSTTVDHVTQEQNYAAAALVLCNLLGCANIRYQIQESS